ncbi:unnamed protein product [Cercospora beticola]|nr:unnamed protein product [Cercospora beticola]
MLRHTHVLFNRIARAVYLSIMHPSIVYTHGNTEQGHDEVPADWTQPTRMCMSLSRLHLWRFTSSPLESNTPTDRAPSGDWIRILVLGDFYNFYICRRYYLQHRI